jgi:hypothetical protein
MGFQPLPIRLNLAPIRPNLAPIRPNLAPIRLNLAPMTPLSGSLPLSSKVDLSTDKVVGQPVEAILPLFQQCAQDQPNSPYWKDAIAELQALPPGSKVVKYPLRPE